MSPTACFSPGEGIAPPQQQIYFPVGLATNGDASRLYVVNSDFDLQFNAGTLQTYDLERLHEIAPRVCTSDADCGADRRCDLEPNAENAGSPSRFCVAVSGAHAGLPCGALGPRPEHEKLLNPGRCNHVEPTQPQDGGSPLIVGSVTIGAFATDVIYRERPGDAPPGRPAQLYVPVRGDATLHWLEVDQDGSLDCGQANNSGACDDLHRSGDDPDQENTRDLRLPPEPFAVDSPADGRPIVVTNQTSGTASLFVNDWSPRGPRLEFALTGLPTRPVGIAAVPKPALVDQRGLDYWPGFLVTFRDAPEVRLIRYFSDAEASPERPFLTSVERAPVSANSVGVDSRGIALDASQRQAAERLCVEERADACPDPAACDAATEADFESCLVDAAATPLRVFVANRTPASLLAGFTRPATTNQADEDLPSFYTSVPLSLGPSRVVVGNVVGPAGTPETRVFVICFDSRRIFVYDPEIDRIEAEIVTGRGPHAFVVDELRGVAYVGHFTDSYLGVISLDQRVPQLYAKMIATVGRPLPPRASK